MKKVDVLVIGRVGIDLYSLDFYAKLKDVSKFAKYVGGGAANISVGLSRLGLTPALFSKVSEDEMGDYILEYLCSQGVDTRLTKKTTEGKSGIVFAEILPGKDGNFIFYRENAADLFVRKEDLDKGILEESKVVVTTGTGLSAEPSRDTNLHAMELSRKLGKTNLLNLDWRPTLWKEGEARQKVAIYGKAIALADILVGNEAEFVAATGLGNAEDAISSILSEDAEKMLLLTRGENGSTLFHNAERSEVSPFRVDFLKGLGAGDGIIAGFVFGLLKGWNPVKAARFGNAVAAVVVQGHSCADSMPTYDEAVGLIEKHRGW
jgi:5-dehydro-2-deoxygluconokinase